MKSTAHVDEAVSGNVLEFDLHGRLAKADYERFIPEIETAIGQYGKVRVLVTMHGFLGWTPGAFWEDMRWNAKHLDHIERLAIVGDNTCHTLFTAFCKPFTSALVRYFSLEELGAAHAWICENVSTG